MQVEKSKMFNCSSVHECVTVRRVYGIVGWVGAGQVTLELLSERCEREVFCPHFGNCPLRGDEEPAWA